MQAHDAHAQRPGIKFRPGPAVGDGLGPRLVQRRFRLVDRQGRAVDLVGALGDQRIEDLAGVADVAEADVDLV